MRDEQRQRAELLFGAAPLPHAAILPVLGIGVRFETDSAAVLDQVELAFGAWRMLAPVPAVSVVIRIATCDGDEGPADRAPFDYDTTDPVRVAIATPGSFGLADIARRAAAAEVSAALVAQSAHFRYGMLEALTWVILTRLDRQPFHAATILRSDVALLLWGSSGRGKSTLAYAAGRAGFGVLADDVAFLQQQPLLRVWGMPGHIHLPLEARLHFPELRALQPSVQANGKAKLTIGIDEIGAAPHVPYVDRAGICILGERREAASLHRIAATDVLSHIDSSSESGFDVFSASIEPAVRQLATRGGWLLHPSAQPDESLPLLHRALNLTR